VLRVVGSLLFWGFIAVSSALLFPIAVAIRVLTTPFDRRLVVLHRFTCAWASLYTWCNPLWRVTVHGRKRVRPGVAYVDILVLFRLFVHFKWVSKIEMFKIPAIGWNMWLNRYVALRRGDRASIAQMMKASERTLRQGSSLMIFPEGTRSADGRLKAFKPGAFTLAKQCRVPILPIVVEGTAEALPKHGFVLRGRHRIRLRVLPAIPPSAFEHLSVEELTARVHALYAEELGEPTAPAAHPVDRTHEPVGAPA